MQNDFKVGDKVRVVANDSCGHFQIGHEGTVTDVDDDMIGVDRPTPKDANDSWYCTKELELIGQPRPEEGDFGSKPTNPKDAIGSDKVPLHLWPTTATVLGSMALLDGALKYGRSNYRGVGVRASIYVDAASRHLSRWNSGEDKDPDSGLPHLAHVLACVAIMIDAQAADKLNDDREYPGGLVKLIEEMTPHVKRLKEVHKDKAPHHYTLDDVKEKK